MVESAALAVIVQTQEEERYRLARALQQGPAQLLANAALEIETYLRLMNDQPDAARDGLTALLVELRQGLNDVRELIADLEPPLLSELGLAASLQKNADRFQKRTGIPVTFVSCAALAERLPSTMEMAIFRIVQETLENVREHSRATAVQITCDCTPEQLTIAVEDNGQGFNPTDYIVSPERRLGFVAMRDRAELLGGQLQVFSEPGGGTRVVLTAPRHGHTSKSSTV